MPSTARRYWTILREQKKPWRFLVSRFLWRTRLCSLFKIQKENYRLQFNPSAITANLWIDPQVHQFDDAFLKRYLRENDTVIDAGANIGEITLTAAGVVGASGRVYSFEAHPRTHAFLRKNVALNKCANVVLFNLALGDRESEIVFSDLKDDALNHVSDNGRGISVKMVRLDEVSIPEPHIQLLKIDVEGYEKFVLEGASKTLEKVSCIYFESLEWYFRRYGYACEDVMKLLDAQGFTILKLVNHESVTPLRLDHRSVAFENLLAVRNLEEFLDRTHFQLHEVGAVQV